VSRFGAHHFGYGHSFGPWLGFGGFPGHGGGFGHGHGGGFGHAFPHFPKFPNCPNPPPPEPENEDPTAALMTPDSETDFWVGETVSFDASASFDSDGSIVSYEWDFGDGNTQVTTDPTVDHTYTGSEGSYAASVTVVDDGGAMDTAEFDFTLAEPAPLVADFMTSPEVLFGSFPFPLAATNTSVSADTDIVSISWEASNGDVGTGDTFATVFNLPGFYDLTLTIEDEIGRLASKSVDVEVTF
jgi:hypothetical protein